MALKKVYPAVLPATTETAVYPIAQLLSYVEYGDTEREYWGSGFVVTDRGSGGRGLLITAAHVINGKGTGKPSRLRVDLRGVDGKVVSIWAERVVWRDDWQRLDIALVALARKPKMLSGLTLSKIDDDFTFDGRIRGFDDSEAAGLTFTRVSGVHRRGWLAYEGECDFPGHSGGPVTNHPIGVEGEVPGAFGVHVGLDGARETWGACAITNALIEELEEALWA